MTDKETKTPMQAWAVLSFYISVLRIWGAIPTEVATEINGCLDLLFPVPKEESGEKP